MPGKNYIVLRMVMPTEFVIAEISCPDHWRIVYRDDDHLTACLVCGDLNRLHNPPLTNPAIG